MSKVKIYIKSILIPLIIGGVVGLIISSSMDYDVLVKPFLSPPGIVFPIVWTILYILMGISYAILETNNLSDDNTNSIYYFQLFFNALWPIIFFVLKWRLIAFIWIIILLILVALMIKTFYKRNKIAGLLQLPYLVWLIFASYLNIATYILN